MTIEVPPGEVYALADAVAAQAGVADEAVGRLAAAPDRVGGPLEVEVAGFLQLHGLAAAALAGELRWLGGTISAVVDSWLGLDRSVLAARGWIPPR